MFGHDNDQVKTDSDTTPTVDNQGKTIQPTTDTITPDPVVPATDTPTDTTNNSKISEVKAVSLGDAAVIEPSKSETDSADPVSGVPDLSVSSTGALTTADNATTPAPSTDPSPAPTPDTLSTLGPSNEPTDAGTSTLPDSITSQLQPPAEDLNQLLSIKQDALNQLTPLVDHLQQTADEKFQTTMMMIQASDDKTLIQKAYDAAKDITDDKERAQALLDIINEINYFTQQNSSEQ